MVRMSVRPAFTNISATSLQVIAPRPNLLPDEGDIKHLTPSYRNCDWSHIGHNVIWLQSAISVWKWKPYALIIMDPFKRIAHSLSSRLLSSYRLDDVLNEEGGCAHVVDVAVEEAEALLGEEVHRDDVVEAALDQHLGDQLHRDVAAPPHLG